MSYIGNLLVDKKKLKEDLSSITIEMMSVDMLSPEYKPLLERKHIIETEIHIVERLLHHKLKPYK
jgi:hypothetical protein